jgi:hypothetical protein
MQEIVVERIHVVYPQPAKSLCTAGIAATGEACGGSLRWWVLSVDRCVLQIIAFVNTSRYYWCLVTSAVVEGSYHLSRSEGGGAVLAAYVSVGTTSLESWSVVRCIVRCVAC